MKNFLFFKRLIIVILLIFVSACNNSNHSKDAMKEGPALESADEVYRDIQESPNADDYKVILSVDGNIDMNENGVLVVWIGAPDVKVSFPEDTLQDETIIPSSTGQYARIIPFAPDFEVESFAKDKCYKIHPSGSEVRFSLKPKATGTYNVSVNIELYETSDCTGASVPKTSETLSVIVEVNTKKVISDKVNTLGDIVWEKFLKFWGALVALIFGALLFLIRRKIKKKTGFEEKEE